jgi:hypothetical protein
MSINMLNFIAMAAAFMILYEVNGAHDIYSSIRNGGSHTGGYEQFYLLGYNTCCLFHSGFLLSLLFNPEDEGDMLLRNVGLLSTDYTALNRRR